LESSRTSFTLTSAWIRALWTSRTNSLSALSSTRLLPRSLSMAPLRPSLRPSSTTRRRRPSLDFKLCPPYPELPPVEPPTDLRL
jgi:hypothetical protein